MRASWRSQVRLGQEESDTHRTILYAPRKLGAGPSAVAPVQATGRPPVVSTADCQGTPVAGARKRFRTLCRSPPQLDEFFMVRVAGSNQQSLLPFVLRATRKRRSAGTPAGIRARRRSPRSLSGECRRALPPGSTELPSESVPGRRSPACRQLRRVIPRPSGIGFVPWPRRRAGQPLPGRHRIRRNTRTQVLAA